MELELNRLTRSMEPHRHPDHKSEQFLNCMKWLHHQKQQSELRVVCVLMCLYRTCPTLHDEVMALE